MTTIILPERVREEVEKAKVTDKLRDRSYGIGTSPWRAPMGGSGSFTLMNTPPKRGSWDDYYTMYIRHAFVRGAIDKIARSATATSFRYISRDGRTAVRKSEVNKLDTFFKEQPNLLKELRRVYKDLLICGDAYLYVVPDRKRNPRLLKRLHPKTMLVEADTAGRPIAYHQFDPNSLTNEAVARFEPHEILHFMIEDPDNDLYGLAPLESLRWAVNTDLYAQRYNAAFFKNSGMTGTIIAIKSSNTSDVERNKKWLEQNYYGPDAAHRPIVLEGEMDITVHKAVTSQNEMGFLQGRRYVLTEILAVLDIPPAKLGIMDSANRANSKEQDKSFRNESIRSLQVLVESVVNEQLIFEILGVKNTIVRHSEADMSDRIELMEYYTKGEAFGIFSPNEVREDLGKPPVDGGDVHFLNTPTGSIPLDRMQLYFQMPQQNTDKIPPVPSDPPSGEPMPKDPNVSQPAGASLTKAKETLGDILYYLDYKDDGALYSAYANAKEASYDASVAIHKSLTTDDELQRKGLIYQAIKHLKGVINDGAGDTDGDSDSDV